MRVYSSKRRNGIDDLNSNLNYFLNATCINEQNLHLRLNASNECVIMCFLENARNNFEFIFWLRMTSCLFAQNGSWTRFHTIHTKRKRYFKVIIPLSFYRICFLDVLLSPWHGRIRKGIPCQKCHLKDIVDWNKVLYLFQTCRTQL